MKDTHAGAERSRWSAAGGEVSRTRVTASRARPHYEADHCVPAQRLHRHRGVVGAALRARGARGRAGRPAAQGHHHGGERAARAAGARARARASVLLLLLPTAARGIPSRLPAPLALTPRAAARVGRHDAGLLRAVLHRHGLVPLWRPGRRGRELEPGTWRPARAASRRVCAAGVAGSHTSSFCPYPRDVLPPCPCRTSPRPRLASIRRASRINSATSVSAVSCL